MEEFGEKHDDYSDLEDENATTSTISETSESEEEDEAMSDSEEEMEEQDPKERKEIQESESEVQLQLEKLKSKKKVAEQTFDEEMIELERKHRQEKEALKVEYRSKKKKLGKEHEQRVKELEEEYEEQMKDFEKKEEIAKQKLKELKTEKSKASRPNAKSQSSLLSLDASPVKEKLVTYCGAGDKWGYRTLLILRMVCKTTKKWVDSLPPAISRDIFLGTLLHLKGSPENVESYLKSTFSSIRIPNLCLAETPDYYLMDLPRDSTLLHRFQTVCTSRLESLELLEVELPLYDYHAALLGAPNLRKFKCHCMWTDVTNQQDTTNLFQNFPFDLESISITHLELCPTLKTEFYRKLTENAATLKYFGTCPFYTEDVMFFNSLAFRFPQDFPGTMKRICQLVEAKKLDSEFTMILNFKGFPNREEDISNNKEALLEGLRSIIESVSVIKLYCFPEEYLQEAYQSMNDEEIQALCNRIYSVPYIRKYSHVFAANDFPNLNCIQFTIPPGTKTTHLTRLRSLTRLGVILNGIQHLNYSRILVPTLTKLRIGKQKSSIQDLVGCLNSISRFCPNLTSLVMGYEINSNSNGIPSRSDFSQVSLQQKKIQRFSFGVECNYELAPTISSIVVKAVSNLPLRKLELNFETPKINALKNDSYAVNEDILKILRTPRFLENIMEFSLNEECVDPAALPLLDTLKLYAAGNETRLRWSPKVMLKPTRVTKVFSLEKDGETLRQK